MSGPEAVSGTAPGRAAYEASLTWHMRETIDGAPWAWEELPAHVRESWDAAAQAAIAAAPAPVVTELLKLAEDWDKLADENDDDGLKSGEAEWNYRANELRSCATSLRLLATAEPVAVVASRDSVARELAAAMAETRELAAETRQLRDALQQVAKHHDDPVAQVRVIARIARRALEGKASGGTRPDGEPGAAAEGDRRPAGQWCFCDDVPEGQEPHDCGERRRHPGCQYNGAHVHPDEAASGTEGAGG